MELSTLLFSLDNWQSPALIAGLVMLSTLLLWQSLAPRASDRPSSQRLDDYLTRIDPSEAEEMARPFGNRALIPLIRRLLNIVGGMLPARNVETTTRMLTYAGDPGGLNALDFIGLRLLAAIGLGCTLFLLTAQTQPTSVALRNSLIAFGFGYMLPRLWLRSRVRRRQKKIGHSLPDALDMLTISVEAGLAFESAMLRVSEQWQNDLTREFRRAVGEMRLGASRNEALEYMVERTGVDELRSFVAVLVQSNQLGISIAQVLHAQAHEMRVKRRQRAEELARQASIKMVVVLVFLVFPALFIVILGPVVPNVLETLNNMAGG